jgi:hypothetical protein
MDSTVLDTSFFSKPVSSEIFAIKSALVILD